MASVNTFGLQQSYPAFGQLTTGLNSYTGANSLLSTSPQAADLYSPSTSLYAPNGTSQTPLNSSTLMSSMISLMGMMLQMMMGSLTQGTSTTATGTTTATTGQSNSLSAFAQNNLSNIEGYFNQDDPTLAHIDDPPPQPAPDEGGEE